jgi:glycosyltransferase involved in cell wall biosynthesis
MADIRPIKILYFHPTYTFGGAERTSKHLFSKLNPEKFNVTLVSSKEISDLIKSPVVERNIYVEDLGMDIWFNNAGNFCKDIKIARRLLVEEEPDIAFAMMHYSSSVLAIARKISSFKGKVISSPRGPSTDYLNTCFPDKKERFFLKMLFGFFCRYSDGIVVPSKGTKDDCVKNYGANSDKVAVINNSVDIETIISRCEEPADIKLPEGLPVIASAGRLTMEKNLPLLLKAFSIVRKRQKARLLIIGDGGERKNLEDLSDNLGISEDMIFLGFQENPHKYLKTADIFVHTCLVEGFGNVIIEAMACGLPVIATDCPYGPREIIEHGKNGLLVPINDAHALADAIVRLMDNENERKVMADAAFKRTRDFSVEKMVGAYENFFRFVLTTAFKVSII